MPTFKEVMESLNNPVPVSPACPAHVFVLENGFIKDGGRKPRIELRQGRIRIGCSEITVEAARYLLKRYDAYFIQSEVTLQTPD